MSHPVRPLALLVLLVVAVGVTLAPDANAGPKPERYWSVDDVRAGMKGYGLSVFKGTKVDKFEVEVLGVLKNVNPGRDLVLVRLSGADLEKTGVIAGMSGSPVYLDDKLLGAVSYAWLYGREPIAGVTPFSQMVEFVESFERRDLAKKDEKQRVQLQRPIRAGGQEFDTVTISGGFEEAKPAAADGLWLAPLQTPLAASGFTQHSLNLLRDRTRWAGITPVQAGGASAKLLKDAKNIPFEPGAALAISLVSGDFDLTGIGTLTHIEGDRVYGWGHPFMSLGQCELPLKTAHIHTVYPRLTVSFKMGSPLHTLGVINADVSTCIAGWLGRKADLMPLRVTVQREFDGENKTFECEMVRQKHLLPQLVYTVLTSSVDMEGELPEELTAQMEVKIEFDDRPALVIRDTYSGPSYSGGRAPVNLYSQIAAMVQTLSSNNFQQVRIKSIECFTRLSAGRSSAEIEGVQLDSETYSPGDTLKATVFLKPYKSLRQRVPVQLKLPDDLPEGPYTALILDDVANARADIRESPLLSNPTSLDHVFQALALQTAAKRSNLVMRLSIQDVGVTLDGKALPSLPSSMVEILSNSRRTGAQTTASAVVSRQSTDWVIQGSQSVKFAVNKNKRLSTNPTDRGQP